MGQRGGSRRWMGGAKVLVLLGLLVAGCGPASQGPESLTWPNTCEDWNGLAEREQKIFAVGLTHGWLVWALNKVEQEIDKVKREKRIELEQALVEYLDKEFPVSAVLGEMKVRCAKRPDINLIAAVGLAFRSVRDERGFGKSK